jgi:hypothetical protein
VQAEPDDTATSLIAMISDSPSTKLKLMFRLCGTRCSMSPFTKVSSICDRPRSSGRAASGCARSRSPFLRGDAEGFAHADDLVRRQRARTHAALVAAAVHLRFDAHARLAAHVQRADALRAVGLVRRERHQVDLQLREVDLDLAGGLRGVDVEDDALLAADLADLAMSWITPISLFTSITDTRIVSGRSAALNTSRSSRPSSFTSR